MKMHRNTPQVQILHLPQNNEKEDRRRPAGETAGNGGRKETFDNFTYKKDHVQESFAASSWKI